MICAVDGCEKPATSRGWCQAHYHRWRRYGDPLGNPPEVDRRRVHHYPWEPLARLLSVQTFDGELVGVAPASQARALGIAGKQVYRWTAEGMPRESAERMAERAGYVPYEIWPEILNDFDEPPSRVCAFVDCDEEFDCGWPYMMRRFCSDRCRRRASRLAKQGPPPVRVCPSDGCGAEFVPIQPSQRWCSKQCRSREINRRRAAARTDKERAERNAYSRQYRATSKRAINLYRHNYYLAHREEEIARACANKRARKAAA